VYVRWCLVGHVGRKRPDHEASGATHNVGTLPGKPRGRRRQRGFSRFSPSLGPDLDTLAHRRDGGIVGRGV
jgi:hypothetical protein